MRKLREIIDVWNVIEKYDVKGWKMERGLILIPEAEFQRILAEAKSKRYILNLRA